MERLFDVVVHWDFTTVVKVGPGSRTLVPQRFADMGCQRVVMITDQGLVAAGVADQVRAAFEAQAFPLVGIFDSIRQDNDTRDINECARWCRELAADGLLAVGGGSVMDAVKCVKVMLGSKAVDINALVGDADTFYFRPQAQPLGIAHISIPTTAGTGADVSQGAVVYNEEKHKKVLMVHRYMNSDFAFLDPELTVTLPPQLTAETAFDALSHGIEAFFAPGHNSMADALALRATRLILDHLPIAVKDGQNIEARTELLTASAMSILAVSSGRGAAPIHNMAHAIGAAFRIPHGQGNAVYVPIVMRNLSSHYLPRIKTFAQGLGIPIDGKDDGQILHTVISEFLSLQEKVGIQPQFPMEVDREQLKKLHVAVKEDPNAHQFPLPDDVISACLEDSLTIT